MDELRPPDGKRLLHFREEILRICGTRRCQVRRVMRSDNRIQVFLGLSLACRGGGGPGTRRGGSRPLHPGISVGLVVVADIEEVRPPFECTRKGLYPDINRSPVACIDDDIGLFACRLERRAHPGGTCGSGSECNIINGDVHGRIGICTLDHAGAAGRDDQHGLRPCRF